MKQGIAFTLFSPTGAEATMVFDYKKGRPRRDALDLPSTQNQGMTRRKNSVGWAGLIGMAFEYDPLPFNVPVELVIHEERRLVVLSSM